jgi:hypothetical protein
MRRLLPKGLPRFGARLGLAALVGVGTWWLLHEPFAAAFRTFGNLVIAGLGGSATVSLVQPQGTALFAPDAQIVYQESGKTLLALDMAAFRFGYTPLAVLGSLSFAAGQWQLEHWRKHLLGLAVVVGCVALSIAIIVLHFGLAVAPTAFPSFAGFATAADLGHTILGLPGFQYVIPAVVWYACTASLPVRAVGDRPPQKTPRRRHRPYREPSQP